MLCPSISAWWARETPGAALDICYCFTTSYTGAVDGTLILSVLQLTRLGCGYPAVPNARMSLEQNAQQLVPNTCCRVPAATSPVE